MSSDKEAKYRARIKIEHFPSRNELIFLINHYLEENGFLKDYKAINQDNQIETAFEVVKRLKIEQLKNPIYSKTEASMSLILDHDSFPSKINTLRKSANIVSTEKRLMTLDGRESHQQRQIKKNYTSEYLGSSPYLSPEEKARIENHKNKMKWLSNNNFNPYVGKATTTKKPSFIPNYVGATPSDTPLQFKFREIHKAKWVGKSTFK